MEKDEIIKAFQLTWDNYPSVALLLNRKHEIVSSNKIARELGVTSQNKCFSLNGNDKVCRWCKAATAMKMGTPIRTLTYRKDKNIAYDSFWIPVSEDFFIHFGNDITAYADKNAFPADSIY